MSKAQWSGPDLPGVRVSLAAPRLASPEGASEGPAGADVEAGASGSPLLTPDAGAPLDAHGGLSASALEGNGSLTSAVLGLDSGDYATPDRYGDLGSDRDAAAPDAFPSAVDLAAFNLSEATSASSDVSFAPAGASAAAFADGPFASATATAPSPPLPTASPLTTAPEQVTSPFLATAPPTPSLPFNLSLGTCLDHLTAVLSPTGSGSAPGAALVGLNTIASTRNLSYLNATSSPTLHNLSSFLCSNASSSSPPPAAGSGPMGLGGAGPLAGEAREDEAFLFDRSDVRGVLIALYTMVFITGFVGESALCLVSSPRCSFPSSNQSRDEPPGRSV